jgi:hypothetical protein
MNIDTTAAERRLPRRRPARHGLQAICRAGIMGLGPDLGLEVRDLSEEGLGLFLREPLAVGGDAEVELTAPWLPHPVKRRAEVVWCRPEGGGFWAGLRLRPRLPFADVMALTRQSVAASKPTPPPAAE